MDEQLAVPAGHIRLVIDTFEFTLEDAHHYQAALDCQEGPSDDAAAMLFGDNGALLFYTTPSERDEFLRRARSRRQTLIIGAEGESSIKILDPVESNGVRRVPLHRDGRLLRTLHAWVVRTGLDVRVIQIGPGVAQLELVPYVACRDREEIRYVRLEELTTDVILDVHRPCVFMSAQRSGESLGSTLYAHAPRGRRVRVVQFLTLEMAR